MKILQIVVSPPLVDGKNSITGPERRAARLSSLWATKEIEVVIAYPRWGQLQNYFSQAGLKTIDFSIGSKFNVLAVFKLKKIISAHNIQLVHCQGPASLDLIATLAAKISGISIVITRPVMLKDQLHYSLLRRRAYELIDSLFTLPLVDGVIAVSKVGVDTLQKRYNVASDKIQLIYNGVNIDRFHGVEKPDNRETINIGMVAQLFPPKGWRDFIDCIKFINNQSMQPVKGFIIGEGEQKSILQYYVATHGLDDVIEFTGFRDDVENILKKLDIFLFTSHREGLSVAVIEAMASSLPIVATNVGGACDQVYPGRNGYLFEAGDIKGMSEACIELMNDPQKIKIMGKCSRVMAEEKFQEKRMFNEHVAYYRKVTVRGKNKEIR